MILSKFPQTRWPLKRVSLQNSCWQWHCSVYASKLVWFLLPRDHNLLSREYLCRVTESLFFVVTVGTAIQAGGLCREWCVLKCIKPISDLWRWTIDFQTRHAIRVRSHLSVLYQPCSKDICPIELIEVGPSKGIAWNAMQRSLFGTLWRLTLLIRNHWLVQRSPDFRSWRGVVGLFRVVQIFSLQVALNEEAGSLASSLRLVTKWKVRDVERAKVEALSDRKWKRLVQGYKEK